MLFPRTTALLAASIALTLPRAAGAQESAPPVPAAPSASTGDAVVVEPKPDHLARLAFDDGRPRVLPPEEGLIRLQIHGEYGLRVNRMQSFPLDPTFSTALAHPGAVSDSLGQNTWLDHWFRITPRLQIGKTLELVGQMDVLTGLVAGDVAHDVWTDQTPRDSTNGLSNVQPRWLYLDWLSPIGLFRVGQQPNHWGMGLVANDGDHASLFGDYRFGSISDGLLFGTKPMGKDGPLTVALGAQYVWKDPTVVLSRGDRAVQGVLAAYVERGLNQIGVYGVYRHQWNNETSAEPLFTYATSLNVAVLDAAGKFATRVVGNEAWLYGSAEVATILGSTNEIRTQAESLSGQRTNIRSYGGAAQLGVVHVAKDVEIPDGALARESAGSPIDWGDIAAQIELGYASGDADPYGDTQKRFTFDPNHKVGLLLFDEVMRFETARAAVAAQDPRLQNAARPTPGVNLLPSNGGVFGAEYINPTVIVRPRPWLDLKGGMVIAQTTADFVDPYRYATQGSPVNYNGGTAAKHDLGEEFDVGFEARAVTEYGICFNVGAQAGVLIPGGAFDDANGNRMQAPWIAIGRFGVMF
jgi:hypothetical protein